MKKRIGLTTLLVLASLAVAASPARGAAELKSLAGVAEDSACGPKCLLALLQVSDNRKPEQTLSHIYELIRKEAFSPTSMKELAEAGRKCGLEATGYQASPGQLGSILDKVNGYAIAQIKLPGETNDFHFILVERVSDDHVICIDTSTLQRQAFARADMSQAWQGYALVLTAGGGMKPFVRDVETPGAIKPDQLLTKDFGVVETGSVLKHVFFLRTTGPPATAKVLRKSCRCLDAGIGKDTDGYPTVEVTLRVDRPGPVAGEAAVSIGPDDQIVMCKVEATGVSAYEVLPYEVYLSSPDGGASESPLMITYFARLNDVVRYGGAKSDIPGLQADLLRSEVRREGDVQQYVFHVRVTYAAEKPDQEQFVEGGLQLALNTGTGDKAILMPAHVVSGKDFIHVAPRAVFFVASKSAPAAARAVSVEMRGADGGSLPDVEVLLGDNLPVKVVPHESSSAMRAVLLQVDAARAAEAPMGLCKGTLTVRSNSPGVPRRIVIPVTVAVIE